MAQDPVDSDKAKQHRRSWLWGAAASDNTEPSTTPQTTPSAVQDERLNLDRKPPEHLLKLEGKLNPLDFQTNPPTKDPNGQIPSIQDAVKSIKKEDFLTVTQTPCARNGLLVGIGSGAAAGGIRFVWRGSLPKATNWAVGSFLLGSIVSYEYCQYKRRQEKINMKRTVEVYQETLSAKRKRESEQRRQQKQLEQEQKAQQKSWYKFW